MLCLSSRSALGSSLAVALLLTSAAADARVCLVRDFNTEFCRKGDDLLYMPAQWGNEQLPIEFIAKKCDSTHQISYTKGAVACVYAGPKEVFDATEAASRVPYQKLYDSVKSNPKGWYAANDGSYWRLTNDTLQKPADRTAKVGDTVAAYVSRCKHDRDGTEHPESYFEKTDEFALESTHYLYQVGPLKDGSIVEVVRPDEHVFYGIRVAPQKGKKKSGK